MPKPPNRLRYAKVHSQALAAEYVRRGWTVRKQFRKAGDEEAYEYLLEWLHDDEPDFPKSRRDKT